MKKFLHGLRLFFEALVSPFNVFIKSNGVGLDGNKLTKTWVVLVITLVLVSLLILFYYREYFGSLAS